jgi:hypothetical protein
VDRRHELENLGRSTVMLHPDQMALPREEAIHLIAELQDAIGRLRRLRAGLVALLGDERAGPWWTAPGRQ